MKAMHPTMAAVKSASLALDEAIKQRDEAIEAALGEDYGDAKLAASVTRAAYKEKAAALRELEKKADEVRAQHKASIDALQAELATARTARADYLKTQPKRGKKAAG